MNPIARRLITIGMALYVWLYRVTGGRIGGRLPGGVKVLLITTTGARTGKRRTTPLGYVRDGEAYVLIASNGGSSRHPGWYHNLRREPRARVEIGRASFTVHAEVVDGEARRALWEQVIQTAPIYARYESKTTREIPLIRLTRA